MAKASLLENATNGKSRDRRLRGLRMVQRKYGRLMAEDVFREAQAKNHPLYSDFEHNQRHGWYQYNLEIARCLISMFRLELVDVKTGRKIQVPMFINFHNLEGQKGAQEYHELQIVRKRPDYMEKAAETAILEILGTIRRWFWLPQIGALCSELETKLVRFQGRKAE